MSAVSGVNMVIERLPASDYVPNPNTGYVDVAGLHPLYDKLAFRGNLVIVGPKGCGKTMSVAAWSAKNNAHIITYDCSEDIRRSNLIGMNYIRGTETPFVLGPITTAFDVANETGSCVLALEELNALLPQAQKILNSCTDFRKRVEVPEAGKVFSLKEGAKLWVVGTMNYSSYGGTSALNEDLKSRFRMLEIGYPMPKDENQIAASVCKAYLDSGKLSGKQLEGVLLLAHETRQKAMEYALSTRDIIQVCEDIAFMGMDYAFRLILGKFEGEDKILVTQRISSIFGIQVK